MEYGLEKLKEFSGGFRGGVRGVRPKIRKAYVIQR